MQKSIRHASDHRSESLEQQRKNRPPLVQGPAQALGAVTEDGADGVALEPGQPRPAERVISFFLVCPSPACHSVPTQMPDLDFRGLRWWMSLLAQGSNINSSPRRALTVVNGATQDDPAIALAPLALLRHAAHP